MKYQKVLVTISGQKIEIDGVLFHSAAAVAKWQQLSAQAQSLLGTFSSGLGVWGSPEVALAGAAVIGFLEAAVTNANQKKGFQILGEAIALHERLRPRGIIIPISEISSVEYPNISRWTARGEVPSEMDVRGKGMFEKIKLKKDFGATSEELSSGRLVRNSIQDLIVLPDDFVICTSGGREVFVKWSSVEVFEALP